VDLRSCCPYWLLQNADVPQYPPLDRDVRCDVAVIGAGLTGALVASELNGAGFDCIVLDRRQPGHGSTAASTALLTYELDLPFERLARRIGERDAAGCYREGVRAVDAMGRLAAGLPDACGFAPRPSLLLASSREDVPMLERELQDRRRNGLHVELLTREHVHSKYGLSAPAALLSAQAAQVDGYRLTHALLRGLRVYSHANVRAVKPRPGGGFDLNTGGPAVRAGRVVLATGYESRNLIDVPGQLVSTYAITTTKLPSLRCWEDRCLIWETAHPYIYLRSTDDGRAMVGGGDEPIADAARRDALIARKSAELLARFRAMFPEAGAVEVDHAWAGFFVETGDGLPLIGECSPGMYLALGLGANGSTLAVSAASAIRDALLRRRGGAAELWQRLLDQTLARGSGRRVPAA
jgi:glycine/D-amino acid oxidase-like deaminating enzyme